MLQLVSPAPPHLASYTAALSRGWSPDSQRAATADDELALITHDATAFLLAQDDREGRGPPIALPDGSSVPRLPGYTRWMWDGEFCGVIKMRWQPGTTALPPTCLGHIGYSVVPWKQRRGYATRALALLLPDARLIGIPFVELTTGVGNIASQRVITANGGVLVDKFLTPKSHGGAASFRFHIALEPMTAR